TNCPPMILILFTLVVLTSVQRALRPGPGCDSVSNSDSTVAPPWLGWRRRRHGVWIQVDVWSPQSCKRRVRHSRWKHSIQGPARTLKFAPCRLPRLVPSPASLAFNSPENPLNVPYSKFR
ncbi:hypothetical protein C8F04DRAFT_1156518, partial [Mycena alexandri]